MIEKLYSGMIFFDEIINKWSACKTQTSQQTFVVFLFEEKKTIFYSIFSGSQLKFTE